MTSEFHHMDRAALMRRFAEQFPEVLAAVGKYESGLLHCEVAVFRRLLEESLDAGRLWDAERYLRFVEEILPQADPDVENALEVSFLEDFALGEWSEARYKGIKERSPKSIQMKLAGYDERWK
jgi:hypothetical protein